MKKIMFAIMAVFMTAMMASSAMAYGAWGNSPAKVRVIHASPDAPNVDVWVNGAPAFTNLGFEQVSEYASLPKGMYNAQVVPAGLTEPVVIDADLKLIPTKYYTVLAVNTLNGIEPLVIVDKNLVFSKNNAKVRFIHASPDAPAVDIAVKNGPVLFSNSMFKDASSYIKVPEGTYDLEVRLAGTETAVLDLPGIELSNGKIYTAIATGLVGEETLNAVLTEDKDFRQFLGE